MKSSDGALPPSTRLPSEAGVWDVSSRGVRTPGQSAIETDGRAGESDEEEVEVCEGEKKGRGKKQEYRKTGKEDERMHSKRASPSTFDEVYVQFERRLFFPTSKEVSDRSM